jgi:phage terminase large subunit-like protein
MSLGTDEPRKSGRPRKKQPIPKKTILRRKGRADDVITFIESLTIPSGFGEGTPFELMKWQKAFIRAIYEPHKAGRRVVRRAILSIARKNGKTALIAAIVLAHLVGPEAEPNGEIYSAANDRDQASIVFKFCKQLVEREPQLMEEIEIISSTKTMLARATGSIYRAVSAEAGTKHGYLPSVVIYDELAQSKNRDLYDVLDTSFGARSEPLFITISTQSNDPEHILSRLIDDGLSGVDPSIVCHLHAADEECELDDRKQWAKANPALGKFRDLEDLAAAVERAKRLPSDEPHVRNLFLNQRVSPHAPFMTHAEWMACAGQYLFEEGEDVYLALDLSSTQDLTALVMGSVDSPARIWPFFWKPDELLVEHSKRDFGAGAGRYEVWHNQGFLLTCPGRTIQPESIALKIAELCDRYRVIGLVYDRWGMNTLLRELDRVGLAAYEDRDGSKQEIGLRLIPWGQGFKDMGPAVKALETAIYDRTLVHPNNPVLNWNMSNAIAVVDPAENKKLDKEASRFRIDGAVALAMLMGARAGDLSGLGACDVTAMIA